MAQLPYRLVVCIDVDAASLKEAYGKVYEALAKLPEGFDWESSDEAYGPDCEEIMPPQVQIARMAYLDTVK